MSKMETTTRYTAVTIKTQTNNQKTKLSITSM